MADKKWDDYKVNKKEPKINSSWILFFAISFFYLVFSGIAKLLGLLAKLLLLGF